MYWHDIYTFENTIEHEFKFAGHYGAKGEKRSKRTQPTPEWMKKHNQRVKEKNMRRLIKANFHANDLWVTLKYPAGTRKTVDELKKDIRNFFRRLKRRYGEHELKYVYRMEVGALGGLHVHMVINRAFPDADIMIKDAWTVGIANFQSLYENGGYAALAKYIVKQPETGTDEYEQLSLFEENEKKDLVKYSASRNLIRPVPQRKVYFRRTMKKLIENGPQPKDGYFIDQESFWKYTDPISGLTYINYTEEKLCSRNSNSLRTTKDRHSH